METIKRVTIDFGDWVLIAYIIYSFVISLLEEFAPTTWFNLPCSVTSINYYELLILPYIELSLNAVLLNIIIIAYLLLLGSIAVAVFIAVGSAITQHKQRGIVPIIKAIIVLAIIAMQLIVGEIGCAIKVF